MRSTDDVAAAAMQGLFCAGCSIADAQVTAETDRWCFVYRLS